MKKTLALVCISLIAFFLICPPLAAQGSTEAVPHTALKNSNIRQGPSTRANKIGLLERGEVIQVIGPVEGESWLQVQLADGRIGYIYARLLERTGAPAPAPAGRSPAPENALAYIITPQDGEIIEGEEFLVRFGLENMGVAPAGVDKESTGHHHLLIDTDLPALEEPIPADDQHIHFGRGQTEYQLSLAPGEHTLQLLLGDYEHRPHDPPVTSEKITVRVVPEGEKAAVMGRSPAPDNARAYIASPQDGEIIEGEEFLVRFGLENMGVAPAGVDKESTGHHHLLIDTDLPALEEPIPADDQHIHFGRGQTEHQVSLAPGEHTLQLLLGDHKHRPHDPPVTSEKITVRVVPEGEKAAVMGRSPAPENARAYIASPQDGEIIEGEEFLVRFGLENMGVAPAGVEKESTGHHHLLIDTDLPALEEPIPADDQHIHFGRGQTEYQVSLAPGEHTLQLLLGDHEHRPHDPPVTSEKITVRVVPEGEKAAVMGRSPAPDNARAYIASPQDGAIIEGEEFLVRFGLENMGVAPAGLEKEFTGHHHLLVDTDLPALEEPIPADDQHIHFGRGQTEYQLSLPPGEHTLQLLLGDHDHRPHDPPVVSEKITVTVTGG